MIFSDVKTQKNLSTLPIGQLSALPGSLFLNGDGRRLPDCRGKVTFNDWKIPEIQKRYDGYFSWYLQEKITS